MSRQIHVLYVFSLVLGLVLSTVVLRAQGCFDYAGYAPPLVGGVDTPGFGENVAVAGSYACVADGYSGLQVLPAQCGFFIEATPDEAFVTQGGTLVQDIVVTNTTDSSRAIQASFAARLPDNSFYPLLGPQPQQISADASFERTLNYPVPPNAPAPFVVGFLSFLLDYASGDTLDVHETWVEIIEGEGWGVQYPSIE